MVAQASPEIRKAVAVVERLSGDARLRAMADARQKAWRDLEDQIEGAREQGIEIGIERGKEQGIQQGIQQGIEQGIEHGKLEEKEAIARQLLTIGLGVSEISRATGLSHEEVEALS